MDKLKEIMMNLISGSKSKAASKKTAGQLDHLIPDEEEGKDVQIRDQEDKKQTAVYDENHYKELFEKKKTQIFNKIKERQKQFISFQDSSVELLMKELKEESSKEEIVCSITRQPLSSSATYFMYAQLHFSNVAIAH